MSPIETPGRNILFLTQHYRPEMIGSAPFCSDLAEWLGKQGNCVTVLTGRPGYPLPEAFPAYARECPKRETIAGVSIERLRHLTSRRRSTLWRIVGEGLFFAGGMWGLITGRIRRSSTVISLCPSVLTSALGVFATRRGGQHVAIVHDIQSGLASGLGIVGNRHLLRLMRLLERVTLNHVDLIGVLSAEMATALRNLGVTTPIIVLPLWVDTDRVLASLPRATSPTTVLYSGNLGKKQGLGQIIELAEELRSRKSEIRIVLRGGGSEYDNVKAELSRRSLDNVGLTGLTPEADFGAALADGDIHLVPQDPNAAAFAVPSKVFNIMAAGRPFVATAGPETALWHLQNKSGAFVCVAPNDPVKLANVVIHLAENAHLRAKLGRRGRHYVEAFHSKELILGRFGAILDKLHGHV
jgi:colanic acid biosynthesis glycosyl transferase WcaI